MKEIILCNHTGSFNRGCDAIIKSTADLFKSSSMKCILAEHHINEDSKFGYVEFSDVMQYSEVSNAPVKRLLSVLFDRILKQNYVGAYFRQYAIWKRLKKGCIAFNVGGDTYCYGRHYPSLMLNEFCYKNNVTSVFWGCSIDRKSVEDKLVLNDLKKYTYIVARESITYNRLLQYGLKQDRVLYGGDPAFTLQPEPVELPKCFIDCECVGINLSPLVMSLSASTEVLLENYTNLINHILESTSYSIVLIPHVYYAEDCTKEDLMALKEIKSYFRDEERVVLLDQFYTSKQLKYIISNCRTVIAARTHASIAAYSSNIPTLVLGYSVKSKGLALDLFGSTDDYVIPVQSLDEPDALLKKYKKIEDDRDKVIRCLKLSNEAIVKRINAAVDIISEL